MLRSFFANALLTVLLALGVVGCTSEAYEALNGPAVDRRVPRDSYPELIDPSEQGRFLPLFEEELHRSRTALGLRRLVRDESLDIVAQWHAEDMARGDYFDHDNPAGEDVGARMRRLQPRSLVLDLRENLHMIETNVPDGTRERAAFAQKSLMESPGHRANIVNEVSTHVGLGRATAVREGVFHEYSVQVFGVPLGRFLLDPPEEMNLSHSEIHVPLQLERREIEWFLFLNDRPRERFTHKDYPDRVYLGGLPATYLAKTRLLAMPPLPPGRATLAARVPGMPPGYAEVWSFQIE